MIKCIKADSENEDFRRLVRELDADLKMRDGEEHTFYSQFNKNDRIKYV
jgi:putative acetyltransferase